MTHSGKQELFEKMKELFNDGSTGTFIEIVGNSPANPKHFDIKMKINGQETRHLCKIIVSDSKSVMPYSIGDVVMSTEISNKAEESNIAFSLIHEQVSAIPYLKGLFDDFGRLYKRTTWYDGYYTKSSEMSAVQPAPSTTDKVAELEAEIVRMKLLCEYATKVLSISRPPEA